VQKRCSKVIIVIIIFFDPGTQFPLNNNNYYFDPGTQFPGEKITLCNIKKVQKSTWNEP